MSIGNNPVQIPTMFLFISKNCFDKILEGASFYIYGKSTMFQSPEFSFCYLLPIHWLLFYAWQVKVDYVKEHLKGNFCKKNLEWSF